MKIFATLLAAVALALAAPTDVDKRQVAKGGKGGQAGKGGIGGLLGGGTCLVFARGSTEPAPLVRYCQEDNDVIREADIRKGLIIGPGLLSALRFKIPSIQSYPVYYSADLFTNISTQRTDAASIAIAVSTFQRAARACNVIVAGGYSQGAAVMHNAVGGRSLDSSIKSKIAGVALFGDTRNLQDGGHIPNFPKERSRVWCNLSDGVCGGALLVNAGHLSYGPGTTSEAATWLAGRISAMGRG